MDFEFEEEADAPRMEDATSGIYCVRRFLDSFSLALYIFISLLCLLCSRSTPVDPDLLVDPAMGGKAEQLLLFVSLE